MSRPDNKIQSMKKEMVEIALEMLKNNNYTATGIAATINIFKKLAEKDGFTFVDEEKYAFIEFGQGQGLVGVLNHIDVVDGWFPPYVKESKLYGRGAIDNVVQALASYFGLKSVSNSLLCRVRLFLGKCEETTMQDLEEYLQKYECFHLSISPDSDRGIIYAEKGNMTLEFESLQSNEASNGAKIVLESFHSGTSVNMVPDHAIAYLTGVKVETRGSSTHSSTPELGENAAVKLATILDTMQLDRNGSRFISLISQKLSDISGKKLGIFSNEKVLGSTTLNLGRAKYVLGEKAEVAINVRYPLNGNPHKMLEVISKTMKHHGLFLKSIKHKSPHFVDPNHPFVKSLIGAICQVTGETPDLFAIGGGTYCRKIPQTKGLSVAVGVCYQTESYNAHQQNEYIEIDDIAVCAEVVAKCALELASIVNRDSI
ncbi:M20/M25/M40 family metallo-hydrolase [Risungbinella massiliensis]|uniref:M20/M25/M40 family metallo-hydrolase n=1 Tax=Risungbinella massiliensis TaxID=1329796 RepID=UPI0005CBCCAA|nr:M20/M25/M40 family metallo-hydrolase [Risungbinella massiliensis]